MRRLLALGLGCGLVAADQSAFAQYPAPSAPRAAVRIVGVRSAESPSETARGQVPGNPGPALPPMGNPMPMPMPMPMGATGSGTSQLPMPRPLGQGPSISEVPGGYPSPGVPYTPPNTYPVPGQSYPVPNGYVPQGSYPGVTLGPATVTPEMAHPTQVYPQSSGVYPAPQLDAPLFEGAYTPRSFHGWGYSAGPAVAPSFGGLLLPPTYSGNRWWLSAEYLLWFTKSAEFPSLITTSSPAFNGILGTGDTRTLLGNGAFGETLHNGGRFTLGRYFGVNSQWAVEGNVFFLDKSREEFRVSSTDFPVLARPFNNVNQNIPFSEVITSPGLATGGASVVFENMVWGAEANLRRRLAGTCCSRLDLIGGFRYLGVSDELRITETFARSPGSPTSIGVPNAMSGTVMDEFRTENHFFGGTFGLSGEVRRGRWFANLTGKVSLGTVYQEVNINGRQDIVFDNQAARPFVGGLLAVPGNIGGYSRNKFAVVPEVGFNIGYQITPYCRAFVGYNFLYLSNALRPGDQIDTSIDITRIPNFPVAGVTPSQINRPTVPFKERDFFAQGVNFGLQWQW